MRITASDGWGNPWWQRPWAATIAQVPPEGKDPLPTAAISGLAFTVLYLLHRLLQGTGPDSATAAAVAAYNVAHRGRLLAALVPVIAWVGSVSGPDPTAAWPPAAGGRAGPDRPRSAGPPGRSGRMPRSGGLRPR